MRHKLLLTLGKKTHSTLAVWQQNDRYCYLGDKLKLN